MYIYKGKNPDTDLSLTKEIPDEMEAIQFAEDNMIEYPDFEVRDEEDEVIFSSEDVKDATETARENMFPDEGSEDGFDYTDPFGSEK